jgi:leucyl-tRNA synthetase
VWEVAGESAAAAPAPASARPAGAPEAALKRALHSSIRKCTQDVERFQFNTAISAVMELVNAVNDYRRDVPADARDAGLALRSAEAVALLLAPVAPHMCEELWGAALGRSGSVHRQSWPEYDPAAVVSDQVELAVQVNGKVRDRLVVAADAPDDAVIAAALDLPNVKAHTAGLTVRKTVVVKGKLVSVVAS